MIATRASGKELGTKKKETRNPSNLRMTDRNSDKRNGLLFHDTFNRSMSSTRYTLSDPPRPPRTRSFTRASTTRSFRACEYTISFLFLKAVCEGSEWNDIGPWLGGLNVKIKVHLLPFFDQHFSASTSPVHRVCFFHYWWNISPQVSHVFRWTEERLKFDEGTDELWAPAPQRHSSRLLNVQYPFILTGPMGWNKFNTSSNFFR